MNKIQDFLKRKGIEDKIVDYDENNEPFTPSYIIEEWEKEQLRIGAVSQQRGLLLAYEQYTSYKVLGKKTPRISKQMVEDFLANDCG